MSDITDPRRRIIELADINVCGADKFKCPADDCGSDNFYYSHLQDGYLNQEGICVDCGFVLKTRVFRLNPQELKQIQEEFDFDH